MIDNIQGWIAGDEKLNVIALYDELRLRYGLASPTDYCALLLLEVEELSGEQKKAPIPGPNTTP